MDKRLHFPSLQEGWLRNSQELTIYNPYIPSSQYLLRKHIEPIRKYLGRTKMAFGEINPRHHKFWSSVKFLKVFMQKNLEETLLCVEFSKAFDSKHRGKMEQILLAYDFPKEIIAAIMMLYKNMKVKVCSLDRNTDYSNIEAGVLQGHTLASCLFIICLFAWNIYRFNERKQLQTGKGKKQKIPRTNYYGLGLCWWHSASSKFIRPSWIPAK